MEKFTAPIKQSYKLLTLMIMLYLTADLCSLALQYKFIKFNDIFFSAEAIIFPLTYTITDIIAEVYGYSEARKAVWLVFLCDTLFALLVFFLVQIPSPTPYIQNVYVYVFGSLLRGTLAEIVGVLSGIFINIYFISKLKLITQGRFFWLRSIGSSLIGEAILVIISMPIMFLGTITTHQLLILMAYTYLFKIIYAVFAAYPATLTVNGLKMLEKIDVYDIGINFNPFALFSTDKGKN